MVDKSSPSFVINNCADENNMQLLTDARDEEILQIQQEELKLRNTADPPQIILPAIGRPSRAFRHFQNPPQPHMCIRHHTIDGQELFINVMSWTRIVMPQNADEPIPLYGGMRVAPSSSRSPPLVYAVMANPEILKHVGRNCPDPEKRLAVVELMCEFVEAMNPGLKLARDAEVLKDRDLSGELKDIWGAVQAKREREKEAPTTYAAPSYENHMAAQNQVTYIDTFGPPDSSIQKQLAGSLSNAITTPITTSAITKNTEKLTGKSGLHSYNPEIEIPTPDATDDATISTSYGMLQAQNTNVTNKLTDKDTNDDGTIEYKTEKTKSLTFNSIPPLNANNTSLSYDKSENIPTVLVSLNMQKTSTITTSHIATPPTSTKKEKLGGFLPNGCHNIFPFIKSKSNHSKKEHKEKKSSGKMGIIDFTKSSQWRSSNNSNSNNNSSSSNSIVEQTIGVKTTIMTTGKIGDATFSPAKSDLIDKTNKLSTQLHDNSNHHSNVCADKMQKLKL